MPLAALLGRLLREPPSPVAADDVAGWWRTCWERDDGAAPIDRAIAAGFRADRMAGAFAAGYQAALRALVAGPPAGAAPPIASGVLPGGAIGALCATETGGNHPRAIATRLAPRPGGGFTLAGSKRWSTMAPLADVLLIVASEGADAAGRSRIRVARVEANTPGMTISTMAPPAFMPEVPHAVLALDGVEIGAAAVLPGDGYTRYVKPFRTVEDLHIHGAVLGYLVSVSRRAAGAQGVTERLVAAVAATQGLAGLDPSAAETHVAVAGLLAQDARLIDEVDWSGAEPAERERWQRDRAVFGAVAAQVREQRRQRAWQTLAGGV
jgi:hypothetical protein